MRAAPVGTTANTLYQCTVIKINTMLLECLICFVSSFQKDSFQATCPLRHEMTKNTISIITEKHYRKINLILVVFSLRKSGSDISHP